MTGFQTGQQISNYAIARKQPGSQKYRIESFTYSDELLKKHGHTPEFHDFYRKTGIKDDRHLRVALRSGKGIVQTDNMAVFYTKKPEIRKRLFDSFYRNIDTVPTDFSEGTYSQKISWKRVKMATKVTPSHTTQRCTSPPGLLTFVPLKEQNDFSKYLYSQFLLSLLVLRRCFYTARRYYKHLKSDVFEKTSSFSYSYSSSSILVQPSFPRSENDSDIHCSNILPFNRMYFDGVTRFPFKKQTDTMDGI